MQITQFLCSDDDGVCVFILDVSTMGTWTDDFFTLMAIDLPSFSSSHIAASIYHPAALASLHVRVR